MAEVHACAVCGDEVKVGKRQGWAREVIGWEEVRSSGGANKIMLRNVTGRVMHMVCIGVQPEQERLDFG